MTVTGRSQVHSFFLRAVPFLEYAGLKWDVRN